MSLQLRKADRTDMNMLFRWANDDTVRTNAFHPEKIPYEEHIKWFEKMMADQSVHQYIFCDGETPVGQIRLNVEGSVALIDYSIAADQRGKGYGSEMLRALSVRLDMDKISNITKIVGQVKYENAVSARTFEKCGFLRKNLPEYIQYEKSVKGVIE